jgi:hypothetical protein
MFCAQGVDGAPCDGDGCRAACDGLGGGGGEDGEVATVVIWLMPVGPCWPAVRSVRVMRELERIVGLPLSV